MVIASVICIGIAIVSFVYFIIIIKYAGIHASFCWFWLSLIIFSAIHSYMFFQLNRGAFTIPETLKIILCLGIIFIGGMFLITEGMIIYYSRKRELAVADYLIVLGAQIKGTKITKSLKYRLDMALLYLEKNKATKVIVSGGKGKNEWIAEANAMKQYLIEHGIEETLIIEEDQSRNTYENIFFSKKYIDKEQAVVIIVTNDFHVFRGMTIAKKQNLGIIKGLAAPTDRILRINYHMREVLAIWKDKIIGNI